MIAVSDEWPDLPDEGDEVEITFTGTVEIISEGVPLTTPTVRVDTAACRVGSFGVYPPEAEIEIIEEADDE